ncbi:MAG: hypothetical protein ACRED5_02820 [Propylenella sp.]
MILGWPFPKRVQLLQELEKTTTGRTYALRFQSKLQYFQVYSVPIDMPKYRLKNGRTAAAQIEYLATHTKTPRDLFSADLESDAAQKVQHELLKSLVSDSGLFDYFKEPQHEQELPFVLTNTGFIVNGNRRVCAMRELLDDQDGAYQRFRTIDIVVLPPSDESDIDWLEGKEQIHKDITADYSWVTTAVMYRNRMTEHDQNINYVSQLYEVDKAEIAAMIDMLAHAESYLHDRGKDGYYSLVEGSEYAFRQLRKFRPKLDSEGKKEVYDQLCYAVIEDPEGDRVYQAVASVSKYFNSVISTMQSEFDIREKATTGAGSLLGAGPSAMVAALLGVLRDEDKRPQVREVIREVLASETEKDRERKKGNLVLSRVKRSQGLLAEAVSALNEETPKGGVAEILEAIEGSIAELKRWLDGNAKGPLRR